MAAARTAGATAICKEAANYVSVATMNFPLLFLKMALSAGTPILRGYLADLDCRWSVISGAVDDRTPEERGLEVSLEKIRG